MVARTTVLEHDMTDGPGLGETTSPSPPVELPPLDVPIDSPAIRRLIEEVRVETVDVPRSYNRTFNRHNR